MTREEITVELKLSFVQNSQNDLYQKISESKYYDEILNLLFSKLNNLVDEQEFIDTKKQLLDDIILSNNNKLCTASLRAPEGYNLTQAMNTNSSLFEKFGGHPQAAGFSAISNNLNQIKEALTASLQNQSTLVAQDSKIYISKETLELLPPRWKFLGKQKQIIEVGINQLNLELLTQILKLDPFGIDFPLPQFLCVLKSNQIKSYKLLGTENKHIKIYFWETNLSVTAFNVENIDKLTGILDEKTSTKNILLVSKLSENIWRETRTLELITEYVSYFN